MDCELNYFLSEHSDFLAWLFWYSLTKQGCFPAFNQAISQLWSELLCFTKCQTVPLKIYGFSRNQWARGWEPQAGRGNHTVLREGPTLLGALWGFVDNNKIYGIPPALSFNWSCNSHLFLNINYSETFLTANFRSSEMRATGLWGFCKHKPRRVI